MDTAKIQEYTGKAIDWAVALAPKLLVAILVLFIGLFLVKKISALLTRGLEKANLDIEIREFLSSILTILMKVAVFLIAASIIGIEFTALLGLLAAMAFAVGMALQGFMGNFASGLTILFLKPYRVGDWVEVSDSFGKVKSIQIFNTTLETPNDKTLIVPNGQVTDNIITNFSTKGNIRLELNVTMPYEESFPKVKSVIQSALDSSEFALKEPPAYIGIESYDSHFIILAVRPYINPDDYWDATFEIYAKIKSAYSANGIKAAYSEGVELGPIGN